MTNVKYEYESYTVNYFFKVVNKTKIIGVLYKKINVYHTFTFN